MGRLSVNSSPPNWNREIPKWTPLFGFSFLHSFLDFRVDPNSTSKGAIFTLLFSPIPIIEDALRYIIVVFQVSRAAPPL